MKVLLVRSITWDLVRYLTIVRMHLISRKLGLSFLVAGYGENFQKSKRTTKSEYKVGLILLHARS